MRFFEHQEALKMQFILSDLRKLMVHYDEPKEVNTSLEEMYLMSVPIHISGLEKSIFN